MVLTPPVGQLAIDKLEEIAGVLYSQRDSYGFVSTIRAAKLVLHNPSGMVDDETRLAFLGQADLDLAFCSAGVISRRILMYCYRMLGMTNPAHTDSTLDWYVSALAAGGIILGEFAFDDGTSKTLFAEPGADGPLIGDYLLEPDPWHFRCGSVDGIINFLRKNRHMAAGIVEEHRSGGEHSYVVALDDLGCLRVLDSFYTNTTGERFETRYGRAGGPRPIAAFGYVNGGAK